VGESFFQKSNRIAERLKYDSGKLERTCFSPPNDIRSRRILSNAYFVALSNPSVAYEAVCTVAKFAPTTALREEALIKKEQIEKFVERIKSSTNNEWSPFRTQVSNYSFIKEISPLP